MSEMVINTAKVLRQITQQQVQATPEELFDVQIAGFNNTIRWNVGHIIYWMDQYSTLSFASPSVIPDTYETLFNSGTKPSDWSSTPPSKKEMLGILAAQLLRMTELTPEMLEVKLSTPYAMGPFQFNTAGELFNFAIIHEAIHLGTITSQLKGSVALTKD
ncbi:formate dehydrogenase [Paenibacillus sp. J23TS9]|uniref:DinB family protein n=1 Tax=Paenibacillus sp. J23TS9 TaxID=2807193 RepID=UPI001B04F46A|nr:DinB family protein [Paenibacillus sp. J23TS9]GIP26458.1 formate dehydrogenase [Paenibacillus sp. J23TS9]